MVQEKKKFGLRYVVLGTLLSIGVVPLLITGWFLSDRSGRELRAAEGRYQTELVRDKANRIEVFGRRYVRLVDRYRELFEFTDDEQALSSVPTQEKIAAEIRGDENLVALFVKPINGESLSAYRSEAINQIEIEKVSGELLGELGDESLAVGQPMAIERTGILVLAVASPVVIKERVVAAVVAITSLRGLSEVVIDKPMSEAELWDSGAPLVFVVDQKGRAVFHPDPAKVSARRSLSDIKIVEEWAATNKQIRSALLPFTTMYKGESRQMIGAYSTANISDNLKFGVIVMQDEARALSSVTEMRRQTWMISALLTLITLIVGTFLARQLTLPLLNLVSAAKTIASGDFSHRIKTKSFTEIGTLGKAFNTMGDEVEEHIAKLAQAAKENKELFIGTVKALSAAIDGKDHYTRGHSERVARVSQAIGQRLNMEKGELEALRISALLHDVGKIGIDDAILKKPAKLTQEEFEIMKTHPQEGYKIMKNIPAMKEYLPGMYMHHEMVNGEGYPQGLSDEEIPLQGKIVSVADAFDAMTIDRPYSTGMDLESAVARIKEFVGTRYDPVVVTALAEACADGQIGIGRVKLKNFRPKEPKQNEAQQTSA